MGMEMRSLHKIKEKVVVHLDNRQIGWLVIGCLGIAVMVFAAGYHVGLSAAPATSHSDPTAQLLAQAPSTDHGPTDPVSLAEETIQGAGGSQALRYTYDRVLTAPTPPAQIDDPTLRIIATLGGDPRDESEEGQEHPIEAGVDAPVPMVEANAEPEEPPAMVEPAPVEAPVHAPAADRAPEAAHEPAAPAAEAAEVERRAEPDPTGYTIQIKAFRHRREARQFIAALREAGYRPYLLAADVPGKGRFYRVRLGRFTSVAEATSRQEAFEKAEGFSTIVTPM